MTNTLKFALLSTLVLGTTGTTFGSSALTPAAGTSAAPTASAVRVATVPEDLASPYDALLNVMVQRLAIYVPEAAQLKTDDTLAVQAARGFNAFLKAHKALKSDDAENARDLADACRVLADFKRQVHDLTRERDAQAALAAAKDRELERVRSSLRQAQEELSAARADAAVGGGAEDRQIAAMMQLQMVQEKAITNGKHVTQFHLQVQDN